MKTISLGVSGRTRAKFSTQQILIVLSVALLFASSAWAKKTEQATAYSVTAFGAKGNGTTKDTKAVQGAIDKCAADGGGTVFFKAGTYLCGTLHLKSKVTLYLDNGATIKGSRDIHDYDPYEVLGFKNASDRETSFFHQALLAGENVEHIAILGQGAIDSNFENRGGPKAIALKRCRFVEIRSVTIENIPNYTISMLGTDNVVIDGVTILHAMADGIDPDACHDVVISNCHIESFDDSIVPKTSFTLGDLRSTENITVTNCYLATACNCFKLGTESGGDFKRISVSNCVMTNLKGRRPASSGVSLESVDGSNLDGVVASNLTMFNVQAPIFIRLGNRGRDMETPTPGSLKNVSISNVVATGATLSCSVTGIPSHFVEGVTLSDIRMVFRGGAPRTPSNQAVPEMENKYPDADMFDDIPSYGMYCRHVKGLTMRNVQFLALDGYWRVTTLKDSKLRWPTDDTSMPEPAVVCDLGPALVCDDVSGLELDGIKTQASADGSPTVLLTDVYDAMIRGCVAPSGSKVFIEAQGAGTADIVLSDNDFSRAAKSLATGAEVKKSAIVQLSNRDR